MAPGAYSFEYVNRWFSDVDDTATAVLASLVADKVLGAAEAYSRLTPTPGGRETGDGAARRRNMGGLWAAMDNCVHTSWGGE